MIIGNGFVANSFAKYFFHDTQICIYAAGVSNSRCTEPKEFERDRARLEFALNQYRDIDKFIYISTCSAGDPSLATMYVQYKIIFEKLVVRNRNTLIIRLPQLAGYNNNPYTLLNYFKNKILSQEFFSVYKNALRNVLDIDDATRLTVNLINQIDLDSKVRILNVANPISVTPLEIVREFEKVLKIKGKYKIVESDPPYKIDINPMLQKIDMKQYSFDKKYLNKIINKYYI